MNDEKYIAQKIRELRKSAGLDVNAVGAGVGRSGKTVSAWETGRNVPSAEMLISICRFFDVGIGYFYPPDVSESILVEQQLPPAERELLALYRNMDEKHQDLLLENARSFAALSVKDGAGITEDVERAGIAVK